MTMRFIARTVVATLVALALPGRDARAGDPEAHAQAIEVANYTVANEMSFVNGLGAPVVGGVAQKGKFLVPNRMTQPCAFTPSNGFGVGCAYATIASESINEPDAWTCGDERQPELMTSINSYIAPYQTDFANALASRVSEVAMVCNWNHFTSNPILPLNGNRDANAAYNLTINWASELTDGIEKNGATSAAACDTITFTKYLQRVYNALHYVQDQTCEHHGAGNLACTNTDIIPIFNSHPIYNFTQGRACMKFLGDTIQNATSASPTYRCDQAVMDTGTTTNVDLNSNMLKVGVLCGFPLGLDVTKLVLTARYPVTSLACAGLERTLRHHCLLDTPKTLTCFGPPSDHQTVTPDGTWCEGENYPGPSGQDFVTLATGMSEPVLRTAWTRFGQVCKQPDDPCVDAQCASWCQRTEGATMDGYCENAVPDSTCTLHQCKCDGKAICGEAGLPCCHGATPCASPLECGGQTGTCVTKGAEMCVAGLVNGDFSQQLTAWKTVVVSGDGGASIDMSVDYAPTMANCDPDQEGNPFALLDVYRADVYLSQTFTVPSTATTLSWLEWGNLDPTTATVSIVSNGVEDVLDTRQAPSVQALSDPNDYFSVICSGNTPASISKSISKYAGQKVELRLRGAYVSGINGLFVSYDNVVVN